MNEQNRQSFHEWLNFGILAAVMLGAIGVVWLAGPVIFERVVPAFLGEPAAPAAAAEELFVPAAAAENGDTAAAAAGEEMAAPAPTAGNGYPAPAAAAESEPTAVPAGEPEEAAETAATHVVQPGETLTSIAAAYSVSVDALLAANTLANPNRIMPGDELVVPVSP